MKKLMLISLFIGIICGAMSYWFQPYNSRYVLGTNIYYLMGVLSFLVPVLIGIFLKKLEFVFPPFYIIGFLISAMGRIIYDAILDSTSHNLWPFEIFFILGVIVPSSFAGAFVINLINKKRKH